MKRTQKFYKKHVIIIDELEKPPRNKTSNLGNFLLTSTQTNKVVLNETNITDDNLLKNLMKDICDPNSSLNKEKEIFYIPVIIPEQSLSGIIFCYKDIAINYFIGEELETFKDLYEKSINILEEEKEIFQTSLYSFSVFLHEELLFEEKEIYFKNIDDILSFIEIKINKTLSEKYKDDFYILIEESDDECIRIDPREDDPIGTLDLFHKRYTFPNESNYSSEEIRTFLEENKPYFLPVYMYDHSSITLSTTPFSCKWDSGLLGYIHITKEDTIKFGIYKENLSEEENSKTILNMLKEEVEMYNKYLTETFYTISIIKDNDILEDFYCYESEDPLETAKKIIDKDYLKL